MSEREHHYLGDLAAVATLAFGGYFLWKKYGPHVAPPPAHDDVMTCLTTQPTWGLSQCQSKLQDLKNQVQAARGQIAAITAGRAQWLALGNTDQVAKIDAAAAPWEAQLAQHQIDYFTLTGTQL